MKLILEVNPKFVKANTEFKVGTSIVSITPPLDENYWVYRVKLSKNQSIVGFPKFLTIAIGFSQEEEDWNTNLPASVEANEIYDHIECNKGDEKIRKEDCIKAIQMIQDYIKLQSN